jgi:hypothetical protein
LTFDWSNYETSLFSNFSCFKSYQRRSYLIEKVFTHTHALHEFSWLLKNFCLQRNLCSLITGLFFICLRIFDKLSDCFLRFRHMCVLISCWRPNLVLFSYFRLWFFLILCLPFVFVWQKGGVFFLFFGPGMYFQTGQAFFCPRMA